jgi:hypothetical protein
MSTPTRAPFTALNGPDHLAFVASGSLFEDEELERLFSGLSPPPPTAPAVWDADLFSWSVNPSGLAAGASSPRPPSRESGGWGSSPPVPSGSALPPLQPATVELGLFSHASSGSGDAVPSVAQRDESSSSSATSSGSTVDPPPSAPVPPPSSTPAAPAAPGVDCTGEAQCVSHLLLACTQLLGVLDPRFVLAEVRADIARLAGVALVWSPDPPPVVAGRAPSAIAAARSAPLSPVVAAASSPSTSFVRDSEGESEASPPRSSLVVRRPRAPRRGRIFYPSPFDVAAAVSAEATEGVVSRMENFNAGLAAAQAAGLALPSDLRVELRMIRNAYSSHLLHRRRPRPSRRR